MPNETLSLKARYSAGQICGRSMLRQWDVDLLPHSGTAHPVMPKGYTVCTHLWSETSSIAHVYDGCVPKFQTKNANDKSRSSCQQQFGVQTCSEHLQASGPPIWDDPVQDDYRPKVISAAAKAVHRVSVFQP